VAVADADAAVAAVAGVLAPGDVVLVKASRAVALDSVANRLLSEPNVPTGGSGGLKKRSGSPPVNRGSGGAGVAPPVHRGSR